MPIMPVEGARLIPAYEIAVLLADEGVPVRAIARSTKISGADIYDLLKLAIDEGKLLQLPKDDWPPGAKRDARAQVENSILTLDDDALRLACCSCFAMTRLQASVFVTILRRPELSRENIHSAIEANRAGAEDLTNQKMVDVVIHNIRKRVKRVNELITIDTLWGVGYSISHISRAAALATVTAHLAAPGTQAAT